MWNPVWFEPILGFQFPVITGQLSVNKRNIFLGSNINNMSQNNGYMNPFQPNKFVPQEDFVNLNQ